LIQEFKQQVIDNLSNMTPLDMESIEDIVENSAFNAMLMVNSTLCFHYSVDYWVKDIMDEFEL
jgi:hypothetical protein